jgi:hypothetical protein
LLARGVTRRITPYLQQIVVYKEPTSKISRSQHIMVAVLFKTSKNKHLQIVIKPQWIRSRW